MNLNELLVSLSACEEAPIWAETQPDLQSAWKACRRSDWMLWLLDKTSVDKNDPRLRLMACDFAEAVIHLVPEGEDRPRKAIETARRFATGEATEEELAAARGAAWSAGNAAGNARAAVWAARAAESAAGAARGAAGNARAAVWAARAAAEAAQSDIIRKYFPECPEIK